MKKKVARIFEELTGKYHVCDDALPHLAAGGQAFDTKASAMYAAAYDGYTHAVGSGTYWRGVRRLPARFDGVSDLAPSR